MGPSAEAQGSSKSIDLVLVCSFSTACFSPVFYCLSERGPLARVSSLCLSNGSKVISCRATGFIGLMISISWLRAVGQKVLQVAADPITTSNKPPYKIYISHHKPFMYRSARPNDNSGASLQVAYRQPPPPQGKFNGQVYPYQQALQEIQLEDKTNRRKLE